MTETPSPLPQKVSRYEIRSEIGRGGMASVYLAYDPNFGREVAIKVLPRELMHDPTFRARFNREARTIATLEHPAIVPVYDFGEEDGQPFLVMRYLSGGSLVSRIRSGPMPAVEAAKILNRIGSALDAAHSKGVVHRDLKPANILFDQYENAYLSDFGIAHLSDTGGTLTGSMVIGTPAYMSPEQVSGDKKVDGRADIYALGIVVFEMLTGQAPFQADSPLKVMMMQVTAPPPKISETDARLPRGSSAVLEKALAKEPDQRYQKAADFSRAFEDVTAERRPVTAATPTEGVDRFASTQGYPPPAAPSGEPPKAPPPGAGAQGKPRRFSPWIALAGIFACLCLVVGGGTIFASTDFGKWLIGLPTPITPTVPPTLTAALTDTPTSTLEFTPTVEAATPSASAVSYTPGQPFQITNGTSAANLPNVAVDSEGVVHVFWMDHNDESNGKLMHRSLSPDGKWTDPECVSCLAGEPKYLYDYKFAAQGDGKACVGFTYTPKSSYVGFIACYRGDGPAETRQLSLQNEQIQAYDFLLALDPSSSLIAPLFTSEAIQVGDHLITDGSSSMYSPAFGIDSKIGYHVFWFRDSNPDTLVYRYSANQGTTWSAPQVLLKEKINTSSEIHLTAGSDGEMYMLVDGESLLTMRWKGTWSSVHTLSDDYISYDFCFVKDKNGRVYLLSTGYFSGEDGIWVFEDDGTGGWTGPTIIRSLDNLMLYGFSAAVAPSGKLLLAYGLPGKGGSIYGELMFVEAAHL
jgi:tRNA A-37 threonylcarbamoyl transferase component Bud32